MAREVPIVEIEVRENVRLKGDPMADAALTESVSRWGILTPLLVDENFVLIAGHRRLAAAKIAGLETVPVLQRTIEGSQPERVALQVSENLFRADLDPLDEAESFLELKELLDTDQKGVAQFLGVSPSRISGSLKLMESARAVTDALAAGRITKSTAIDLARMPLPRQEEMLDRVIGKSTTEAQRLLRDARKEAEGSSIPGDGETSPPVADEPSAPSPSEEESPPPPPPEEPSPPSPSEIELRDIGEVETALAAARASGSVITAKTLEWVLGLRDRLV